MPKKRGNDAVDKRIGQRVRQLRLQLGMSQEALGKELGLTFQQVQKYEKGTNRIAVSRMLEIARILQTSPEDIMGKHGDAVINNYSATVFEAAREFSAFSEDMQIFVRKFCALLSDTLKKKR